MHLVVQSNNYYHVDEMILSHLGIDVEPGIHGMIIHIPTGFGSSEYNFVFDVLTRLGIKKWDTRDG